MKINSTTALAFLALAGTLGAASGCDGLAGLSGSKATTNATPSAVPSTGLASATSSPSPSVSSVPYENTGIVTTFAGSTLGTVDGVGTAANFSYPQCIAAAPDGTLYVTEPRQHRIRKISTSGEVSVLAGGTEGNLDGTKTKVYPNGWTETGRS